MVPIKAKFKNKGLFIKVRSPVITFPVFYNYILALRWEGLWSLCSLYIHNVLYVKQKAIIDMREIKT
jgi:hypothetical protein